MKFSPALLAAFAAISIGQVAAQRNGGRFGQGGNQGGNKNAASSTTSAAAASTTSAAAAAVAAASSSTSAAGGGTASSNSGSTACLNTNAIQSGSNLNGQEAGAEAGQSPSLTDPANFINFCSGQTLTNGAQVRGGSCNGIPMGQIPSTSNMISSVIVFPSGSDSDNIAANAPFTIKVKTTNLVAGTFTNPDTTYYSAPQFLKGGSIVGHTHVTVQDAGGSLPNSPMDPGTFAFFKGINTPVDGNGELTANVTQGLPAGFYRVCTMGSAANHQPVTMPIAQRGAQDDCRYFSVGGVGAGSTSGSGGNGGGNTGNGNAAATSSAASSGSTATGGNSGKNQSGSGSQGSGAATGGSGTTSASTGSSTATGGQQGSGRGGRGGRFGGGKYRGRFMARGYVA